MINQLGIYRMVLIRLAIFQVNREATMLRSVICLRQGVPMAQAHHRLRDVVVQTYRCSQRRLALGGAVLGIILRLQLQVVVDLPLPVPMGLLSGPAPTPGSQDRGMNSTTIPAFDGAAQRRLMRRGRRNLRITSRIFAQPSPGGRLSHCPWTMRQASGCPSSRRIGKDCLSKRQQVRNRSGLWLWTGTSWTERARSVI